MLSESVNDPEYFTDWTTGLITGPKVEKLERRLRDLGGVFADVDAFEAADPTRLVYRTACVFPLADGTEGGLFWATSFVEPGLVGDEYHMTKGHFHAKADRAETYFTYTGTGLLLLMSRDRRCWAERMTPGSTHFVPPVTAHRTINTGDDVLAFGASWPSDAGHDYATIAADGFAARVRRVNGTPQLVAEGAR